MSSLGTCETISGGQTWGQLESQKEKRENGVEEIFEEIIIGNLPNMVIKEAQQT